MNPFYRLALFASLLLASGGWLLAAEGLPTPAAAKFAPPIDILYGAYQIIGRQPEPDGESYQAWVRIAVEGNELTLDRCFKGEHSEGRGEITQVTADQLPAVRLHFIHNRTPFEATCTYHGDFDNLPRFSCYTYPKDDENQTIPPKVPGLEAYFPIIWPVDLAFFDCQ